MVATPTTKSTAAAARTEMKVRDCRSRAVETRSVISALVLLAALEVLLLRNWGKRLLASVSTERPLADWQRVPSSSMPQMP